MSLPPRARIVIIVVAALAVAAIGTSRLFDLFDASADASPSANVGGLTAAVTTAGWTAMDHDMSTSAPGYQMPSGMMPGMPDEGKQRLSVTVAVTNTTDEGRLVRPGEEFVLYAGKAGARLTPQSHTFGELPRLAPHNAVTGALFFDLAVEDLGDSPAWLEWSHDGTSTKLSVPLNGSGSTPDHPHKP
jgi:hypothetical protein